MASRDLHNNVKVTVGTAPIALTGNTTTNAATIDTQGFESLEIVIQSGVITDGTETPSFYEGDASNMSDESVIAATDLIGTMAAFAATDDGQIRKIGYKGNKRYVRVKLTGSGQTTGGLFSVLYIQGHAKNAPVA
jgi:hypothetical protein